MASVNLSYYLPLWCRNWITSLSFRIYSLTYGTVTSKGSKQNHSYFFVYFMQQMLRSSPNSLPFTPSPSPSPFSPLFPFIWVNILTSLHLSKTSFAICLSQSVKCGLAVFTQILSLCKNRVRSRDGPRREQTPTSQVLTTMPTRWS